MSKKKDPFSMLLSLLSFCHTEPLFSINETFAIVVDAQKKESPSLSKTDDLNEAIHPME
jgi:hypothetical protein